MPSTANEDGIRFLEWCKRIPGYSTMSRNTKKSKKRKWKEMEEAKVSELNIAANTIDVEIFPWLIPSQPAKQKKEKAMYNDFTYSKEQEASQHLEYRLDSIWEDKVVDLQKTFGLRDDNPPLTPREIIDRITKGQFKVADDNMDREVWNPFGQIRWRDPSRTEDYDGFGKARDAANAARTKTLDEIRVLPAEKGLEALRAFESATFH